MSLTEQQLLIANGYIRVGERGGVEPEFSPDPRVATLCNNMAYFGYIPSLDALQVLQTLDDTQMASWWESTETALKELTADNRRMDDFVVYQNFPQEVLEMDRAEYWIKQILMYFGFDKENFTEEKIERDPLFEKVTLKVLHPADGETLLNIYSSLLRNKARWSVDQLAHAKWLQTKLGIISFKMGDVAFRENGIQAVSHLIDTVSGVELLVEDATDVLRLAALRSDGDVSLRTKVKFKSFPKSVRRVLCSMLENSKHLEADLAERPREWKQLLRKLHPGDFKFARLRKAYDDLYNGRLRSFASRVETGIRNKDADVLTLLQGRPGEYLRRFHHLCTLFGHEAATRFIDKGLSRLTTMQLLKLLRYVETNNGRKTHVAAPRGNWTKLQIKENNKSKFSDDTISALRTAVGGHINERLKAAFPEGFDVDPLVEGIKLQTNDQELASYGRGTVFPIPDNMKFLRTASYWENKGSTSWFDNGWNFFDEDWQHLGACCWNAESFPHAYGSYNKRLASSAAIFSGDPVNSKELKGRACQMIDLYIDRLVEQGVRFAVWNILSYSRIPFSDATGEVVASLQWGEEPEQGKLYEPGRAQVVFPLGGQSLTKYIAYVDLVERKMIYMDANLRGRVSSAAGNGETLQEQMPAFVEYLESLPSVADLFRFADKGSTPILYSDADRDLEDDSKAYVFKPENHNNSFAQVDLTELL